MARVLVIDDSETVVRAVRATLALDGHHVDQLDFFVDLARVLKQRPPDLVVLDLEMPGFNGVRLGTFLRQHCKSSVPVIVYSSRPAAEIDGAVKAIGASAGLEKSASQDELRRLVRHHLSLTAARLAR